MRGLFIDAWEQALTDIWASLYKQEGTPLDLFAAIYPELAKALKTPPSEDELITVSNDADLARLRFFATHCSDFSNEFAMTRFWEDAFDVLQDSGPESLGSDYAKKVKLFLERYNLRYRMVTPCRFVPRLPALLGGMIEEVELRISADSDLAELHQAAESAFEDLTLKARPSDIRNCILRVCNLAEGLAVRMPGITETTLGKATKQMQVWPHATVRNSLSSLYGFCSDYPAIRHGSKSEGKLRELELKDALVISMAILGFTGYLTDVDFERLLGIEMTL